MAQETAAPRRPNYVYHLFIFALTVFSLVIMVVMFLPLDDAAIQLLQIYDNLICIFFLIDFFLNLRLASNKSFYFFRQGGWLDLLGSIPVINFTYKFLSLLRLARLSRLRRIAHLLRDVNQDDYIEDVLKNRTRYTAFITILLAIIVLASASVMVIEFESAAPGSNITTGWDALWYSIVTITTVGYGDHYPVTFWGRMTAIVLMISGVGIIGALASLLSSFLLNRIPRGAGESPSEKLRNASIEKELADIKQELADLRELLEKNSIERTQK